MEPIIITVAPNGAQKNTNELAHIPITPQQIATTAKECQALGTTMLHLHVRDFNQKHTLDVGIYRETINEIKKEAGEELIIQCTCEAANIYTPDQQIAMVYELKPEAISIALRELIHSAEEEKMATKFFRANFEAGILQQYILYSTDDVRHFVNLRKKGLIPGKKVSILFVLGKKFSAANDTSSWSHPDALDPYLEMFDGELTLAETIWSVCAFGGNENAIMQKVIQCGGNPRIGFENNHFMADGSVAPNNASLIEQFTQSNTRNRVIATPQQARKLLADTLIEK